jgi:opacity protein-like surface antigen
MARTPLVLTVLALAGLSLAAQAKPKPKAAPVLEDFRFGVQVGLASGTTDSVKYLTDKKQGYVVGVQGTWAVLSPSHLLRARLDLTNFPSATVTSLNGTGRREDNTIKAMALGLDYLFFTRGLPEGFYLTGGGALTQWKQDNNSGDSKTHNAVGVALGLGWQFNRTFGLEMRTNWARWQTNFRPGTIHNAGTANLEASFRF